MGTNTHMHMRSTVDMYVNMLTQKAEIRDNSGKQKEIFVSTYRLPGLMTPLAVNNICCA